MNKIEINIDATALGSSGCILNLARTIIGDIENGIPTGGYKEKWTTTKLIYGVAVHKFIDTMYKTGGKYPQAIKEAVEAYNSVQRIEDKKSKHLNDITHLKNTCFGVWSYIEQENNFDVLEFDGKPATEITFAIPYWEDDVIKVSLRGTIDRIGKIKGGCYAIRDWKTTSSWDNSAYFTSYELSKQLRIYTLACRLMARFYPDSILGKIGSTTIGCFIDAIFLKSNANENIIKSSDIFSYKDADIEAFELTLKSKLTQLSRAIADNSFPKEGILNGSCEAKWGKCKFWNVCANDSVVGKVILKRDFITHTFDPLKYNEIG